MKISKYFLLLVIALSSSSALGQGGVYKAGSFMMFSRANCPTVNESITYTLSNLQADLETYSRQNYANGTFRTFADRQRAAWRSRAGCELCSFGGAYVSGWHRVSSDQHWSSLDPVVWDRTAIKTCFDKSPAGACYISATRDCNIGYGWGF